MLRVRREKNGLLTVSLDRGTAEVLRELPQRLRAVLQRRDFSDRVVNRLFPKAYRSKSEETEYRRLLGQDLLKRKLEGVEFGTYPRVGVAVPTSCPEVPAEELQPRGDWADPDAYDAQARKLAAMFEANIVQFADGLAPEIVAAGPKAG